MVMKVNDVIEALGDTPVWHYKNKRCRAVPESLIDELVATLREKKPAPGRPKKAKVEVPESNETFGGKPE